MHVAARTHGSRRPADHLRWIAEVFTPMLDDFEAGFCADFCTVFHRRAEES
jgi:hypothetical protein